jgi:CheY-like chemotaxis protein/tRNA A-37 threonylcarbamoyl transferase component Bud32
MHCSVKYAKFWVQECDTQTKRFWEGISVAVKQDGGTLAAKTVLVVDDEPEIRELVSNSLSELGYVCTTAGDGQEAQDFVAAGSFDLVVTDIRMPRKGGIELIRWIRNHYPQMPVIVMSGYADFETAREAIRLGVSDYLSKPFESLREVQAAVRRAIGNHIGRAEPEVLADELNRRLSPVADSQHVSVKSPKGNRILGGYEVLKKIGEGGMGAVYKARQISTGRIVALKVMSKEYQDDEEAVKRLLLEARVAMRLDHPNIVRGLDAGRQGGTQYFAMEFVDGETVGDLLQKHRILTETAALKIALQVAHALEHIWEIKLVHRDIKPDNILIARDGTAKLTDLGLTKLATRSYKGLTRIGIAVGSPNYMSPEQIRDDEIIDFRTDVYSLGATLFCMVVGTPPFSGNTAEETLSLHLTEKPPLANVKNTAISEATALVIDRMLQKEPDDRYLSLGHLIIDLEAAQDGKNPPFAS